MPHGDYMRMSMGVSETSDDGFGSAEELGPFFGIFGNTKNAELLQLLISVPDLELNKSQLSRVLGITFPTVTKILKRLERFKIVSIEENIKTQEKLCRLNINSPIVQIMNQFNLMLSAQENPIMELFLLPSYESARPHGIKINSNLAISPRTSFVQGQANSGITIPFDPQNMFENSQATNQEEVGACLR